jgi:hypothetical protein
LSPESIPSITIIILSSEFQYHIAWYNDTNIPKIYTVSIVRADVPFCILALCSLGVGYNILEQSAALPPFRCSCKLLIHIHHPTQLKPSTNHNGGQDSSVGIATRYELDGLGIESWWRRDFLHPSKLTPGPTQPPIQWVPGLSQG